VGEWFWLRLQNRNALGIKPTSIPKLNPRFYGPFKILERIHQVSYRLQLLAKVKIHDVFHASLLKKFESNPPESIVQLPEFLHGRVVPSPDSVVKARFNRGVWEVLVQWVGRSAADTSWERLKNFNKCYPTVQLDDKLFVGRWEVLWMLSDDTINIHSDREPNNCDGSRGWI
jgi:hypothetical protein